MSETKTVWLNLTSHDPRKKAAVAAIRQAAGVATARVTLCKISKDGTKISGRIPDLGQSFIVERVLGGDTLP